jgi:hypothetical protein
VPIQKLTVGDTYDYNMYFQGGKAYFDFAGVQKAVATMSDLSPTPVTWLNDSFCWLGEALGEIGSYDDQMPGTALNQELFSSLEDRRWAGSGTTWYNPGWTTGDNDSDANDYPAGYGSGNLNTFFNAADSQVGNIWAADTCYS